MVDKRGKISLNPLDAQWLIVCILLKETVYLAQDVHLATSLYTPPLSPQRKLIGLVIF